MSPYIARGVEEQHRAARSRRRPRPPPGAARGRAHPGLAARRGRRTTARPSAARRRNGAYGQASCLVAQARPSSTPAQHGAIAVRRPHGRQHDARDQQVVRAEDLVPPDERVHEHDRGRRQPDGAPAHEPVREERGRDGTRGASRTARRTRRTTARQTTYAGAISRCVPGR